MRVMIFKVVLPAWVETFLRLAELGIASAFVEIASVAAEHFGPVLREHGLRPPWVARIHGQEYGSTVMRAAAQGGARGDLVVVVMDPRIPPGQMFVFDAARDPGHEVCG